MASRRSTLVECGRACISSRRRHVHGRIVDKHAVRARHHGARRAIGEGRAALHANDGLKGGQCSVQKQWKETYERTIKNG